MSLENPTTFTEASAALDEIAGETTGHKGNKERLIADLHHVQVNVTAMGPTWTAAVSYIDQEAAANPGDDDWQRLKSVKDKMVADFIAEKAAVDDLIAAIDAV